MCILYQYSSVTMSLIPTSLLQAECRRAPSGHRVRSGHCQIQLQRRDIARSLIASAHARSKHHRPLRIAGANVKAFLCAHCAAFIQDDVRDLQLNPFDKMCLSGQLMRISCKIFVLFIKATSTVCLAFTHPYPYANTAHTCRGILWQGIRDGHCQIQGR